MRRLASYLALALATGVAAPVAQATDFTDLFAILRVKIVRPGDPEHCNGDLCVTNDPDSGNSINVDPARGTTTTDSTVEFKSRAKGSVTGLDAGDVVNVSSSGRPTITGNGGTINLNGTDIQGRVTNTAREGGASIRINYPGGGYFDVPPGTVNGAFGT